MAITTQSLAQQLINLANTATSKNSISSNGNQQLTIVSRGQRNQIRVNSNQVVQQSQVRFR